MVASGVVIAYDSLVEFPVIKRNEPSVSLIAISTSAGTTIETRIGEWQLIGTTARPPTPDNSTGPPAAMQ